MNDRKEGHDRVREQAIEGARRATRQAGTDEPLVAAPRVRDEREVIERGEPRGERMEDVRTGPEPEAPLFSPSEADQLRTRWESVQASFVDEPRQAVEEADDLVRTVMERLTDGFAHKRERLEQEWGARDAVSTEDLRMALRHYRSFFDRLLRM